MMMERETGVTELHPREGHDSQQTTRSCERGKEGFLYRFQRQLGPPDTLILDFWSPELWDNKFILL